MKKLLASTIFSICIFNALDAHYWVHTVETKEATGEYVHQIGTIPANVAIIPDRDKIKADLKQELGKVAEETIAKMAAIAKKYAHTHIFDSDYALLSLKCTLIELKKEVNEKK